MYRLWPPSGVNQLPLEPTYEEWEVISSWCEKYQTEMLLWSNGAKTDPQAVFDGTIKSLSTIYQTDEDSPFKNLRYKQRLRYTNRLTVIEAVLGAVRIKSITFRDFKRWHEEFAAPLDADDTRHEPRAYDLIEQLRLLFKFGKLALPPDSGCAYLCEILSEMEFTGGQRRRKIWMTHQQASLLCAAAHRRGFHSIALAQAFMIECGLRQKDMIGEWVPRTEPGVTDIFSGGRKWLMGARWEEIDSNMVWKHRLSKSIKGNNAIMSAEEGKEEEFDLFAFPLIMAELRALSPNGHVCREAFPASGPIIIYEKTGRPWCTSEFRRQWRLTAREAGIPDAIQNRDSRPGAATEAKLAGAAPQDVQRLLGHAREDTTQIYLREGRETRSRIARLRAEKRK
jgi:integrase